MRKKISLIILNQNGRLIKEITLSMNRLILLALILAVYILTNTMIIFDRTDLENKAPQFEKLKAEITLQTDKVALQRIQLNGFANDIKKLRAKLLALKQSANEIKIIAGLERIDDSIGRFGIGGTTPDGLTDHRSGTAPAFSLPQMRIRHD